MESLENQKIPFGILNGVPVGIECVKSGLSCNCICPSCGGALQARKGEKNVHHFSHDPSANKIDCKNALETSIHLMAKQIIYEEGSIEFPELLISVSDMDISGCNHIESEVVFFNQKMEISEVSLEQRISEIRPDIIAYVDEEPVLIEIAVTHLVDKFKKEKIRELNLQAIEVNLSKVNYQISKSELRDILVDSVKEKSWIYYPDTAGKEKNLKDKLNEKIKKINLTIQANRILARKASANYTHKVRSTEMVSSYNKKIEYAQRWLVCKECHFLWNLTKTEIPDGVKTLRCPKCQFQVSTLSPN